jgi:ADP-heptose:LPS heptosyltransferase
LGGKVNDNDLELWTNKDDEHFAELILKENNLNKDCLFIGVGLGARESRRTWPVERYLKLIEKNL